MLTEGGKVLILMEGPVPSNYCPITYLYITWKLLSGIIVAKIKSHVGQDTRGAWKGIGRNTQGAKHQLVVE